MQSRNHRDQHAPSIAPGAGSTESRGETETETHHHQTWLPSSCTGQCTPHCLSCTSNASLCSPQSNKREQQPHAMCLITTDESNRSNIRLRRDSSSIPWMQEVQKLYSNIPGFHNSLLVVHAVYLKGWTLGGQLGYNRDHAIFNSDFRPGNNPRARLSSI